jgi:hypothetical protein
MIGADSIAVVLDVLEPERAALVALLEGLEPDDWVRPTECPAYSIKGVATHVLGDDLSLLSRQRDGAEDGLVQLARDRPGADFRTLLDTFNDRWVAAAGFLSTEPCRPSSPSPSWNTSPPVTSASRWLDVASQSNQPTPTRGSKPIMSSHHSPSSRMSTRCATGSPASTSISTPTPSSSSPKLVE